MLQRDVLLQNYCLAGFHGLDLTYCSRIQHHVWKRNRLSRREFMIRQLVSVPLWKVSKCLFETFQQEIPGFPHVL